MPGEHPFHGFFDVEYVVDVLQREGVDPPTSSGLVDQQALVFQATKPFPDRRTADAESAGYFAISHILTGLELQVHDLGLDKIAGLLLQGGGRF